MSRAKVKAIDPNLLECSHCWRKGHRNKRECPDKRRPHEELVAEAMRENKARRNAIDRVAQAIAACPIDSRVELTIIAFKEATSAATRARLKSVCDRAWADERAVADALGGAQ